MKKACLFLLAVLLLPALPLPVHADEEAAKYNFASAQGDKELKIPSGEEGVGSIYFYNIDGNRITHITLEASQVPPDWEVTIEPPLSETQVLVSGMPVMVEENLYVEPSELLTEEPQSVPEGMVSLKIPGRGYALGKLAQVIVTAPESAPLGSSQEITIAAEAAWLGQSGAAAIRQARDFDFSVTVISSQTDYTETIVEQGEEIPGEATGGQGGQESEEVLPPAPAGKSAGFLLITWLPVIIAVAVVILGAVFIPMLVRKRR
jgi:hypothetical protein